MRFQLVALAVALAALGFEAAGDDAAAVIPHRQDRVPNKPVAAEEAARRMTVPEGFHVDLVASEPQIINPFAMCFDDRGRIWITESVRSEFGISQPAVSQHLRVLREAGFATVRPEGARRLYAVNAEPLRDVDAWLDHFRAFWTPRLDALATEIARGRRQRRLRATPDERNRP